MSSTNYLRLTYEEIGSACSTLMKSVIGLSKDLPSCLPPLKSVNQENFTLIYEHLDECENHLTSIREKVARLEGYSDALSISPAFKGDLHT